jgi:hypothetical protein
MSKLREKHTWESQTYNSKMDLKEYNVRTLSSWKELTMLRPDCCEHGKDTCGSIKGWEFVYHINEYELSYMDVGVSWLRNVNWF